MENKFGKIFQNEGVGDGYINFNLWQIILIGLSLVIAIVNASITGQGVVVWIVNFLLQLATFVVGAAIIASLVEMIFKRGWATVFAVLVIAASLFGTYDAIRGVNYRKAMEKAYQEQVQKAQQEQAAQQAQQQQSGAVVPARVSSPVIK
jgi:glucan phosphoethanolaminetransferase (alkaline phosphatase superfamily)